MKKNNIKKNVLLLLLCWMMGSGVIWAQDNNFHTVNGVARFSQSASAPENPVAGMIYFNTTDKKLMWYDGEKWIDVGTPLSPIPSVSNAIISGEFFQGSTVSASYDFVLPASGSPENESLFQWLIKTPDGTISNMTGGTNNSGVTTAATASSATANTLGADVAGNTVSLRITPRTLAGSEGAPAIAQWESSYSGKVIATATTQAIPVAFYKGLSLEVGQSHTAGYAYEGAITSASCDESGATFRWLRSDQSDGSGALTELGSGSTYTVQSGDVDKYIALEVSPNNTCTAITVKDTSSWKQVIALTPSIATVEVSGTYSDGTTTYALKNTGVTASFTGYSCTPVQPDGDSGSNSTFQWYWSSDDGTTRTAEASDGSTSTYTVNTTDASYTADAKLACGITPVSSNGDSGTERIGEWLSVPSLTPAYADVTIGGAGYNSSSGKVENEKTITAVTGNFLSGISGLTVPAGTPAYRWVYSATGGSDAGTDMTNLGTPQLSSHAVDVTAGHGYTDDTYYIGVYVTAMAGNGESGTSEVFSGWKQVSTFECGVSTVAWQGVTFNTVSYTATIDGNSVVQCWLDRNLGATSLSDPGSYYQWCRGADGHQDADASACQTTRIDSLDKSNPKYINNPPTWAEPNLTSSDLWWNEVTGTAGENNPCPSGWHVPTEPELKALIPAGLNTSTLTGFNFVCEGYKGSCTISSGAEGILWTSTIVSSTTAYGVDYRTSTTGTYWSSWNFSMGCHIRCTKD